MSQTEQVPVLRARGASGEKVRQRPQSLLLSAQAPQSNCLKSGVSSQAAGPGSVGSFMGHVLGEHLAQGEDEQGRKGRGCRPQHARGRDKDTVSIQH